MSFRLFQQIFLIGASLAIIFWFIRPQLVDIQAKGSELEEYKSAVANAGQFNSLLRQLVSEVDSIPFTSLQRLNNFLPSTVDEVMIARDIQSIALSNNMVVSGIQMAESSGLDSVNQIQREPEADFIDPDMEADSSVPMAARMRYQLVPQVFTVTLLGSYDDLNNFLRALETNSYPLHVTALAVNGDSTAANASDGLSTQTDRGSYSLTVQTYYMQSN